MSIEPEHLASVSRHPCFLFKRLGRDSFSRGMLAYGGREIRHCHTIPQQPVPILLRKLTFADISRVNCLDPEITIEFVHVSSEAPCED